MRTEGLGGNILSALSPSAGKDVSPRFGFHSLTEAVYFLLGSFLGLVGLFHFVSPFLIIVILDFDTPKT